MIRVGIGGWVFKPWRGEFYPEGLPQARELDYASRKLTAIEINGTFYSTQKPESFRKWAAETPDDFVFSLKAPRFATHRRVLAEAGESIERFVASGLGELGPKLGPILWQFLPRRKFDAEDIAGFFRLLPEKVDGITMRHAIEPRDESFRDKKFFRLCRDRNIAIVHEDADDYPLIEADTADFVYARLQRMRAGVTTGYDEKALKKFAALARKCRKGGRDTYIFMINGAKERAPAAALALQERLR